MWKPAHDKQGIDARKIKRDGIILDMYSDIDVKRVERYNGILLGAAIILNYIVGAINDIVFVSNLFPLGMLLLGMLTFAINIALGQEDFSISVTMLGFVGIFTVQIMIALNPQLRIHKAVFYAQCYVFVGLTSLYMATRNKNIDSVRHSVLAFTGLFGHHLIKILNMEYTVYTAGDQMGNAYAILAIIFSALWTLIDSHDSWRWKCIACVELLLCSAIMIKVMTRGAWLCIFIFIGFLVLKKSKEKHLFIYFILGMPILVIVAYIVFVKAIKESSWYNVMFSMKSDDILNGRGNLLKQVMTYRGLFQTLFGSGVGAYFETHQIYPHNVLAQLYYDQGLLVLLYVLHLLCGIVKAFKGALANNQEDYLIIVVVCSAFVKLMVSSYFWIEQMFWIMIGLLIRKASKV